MNVLCLAPDTPFGPQYGGSIDMRLRWEYVAKRHQVTVLATVKKSDKDCGWASGHLFCVVRPRLNAACLLSPVSVASRWSAELRSMIDRVFEASPPDVVCFESSQMYEAFRYIRKRHQVPTVVRVHNIESEYFRQLGASCEGFISRTIYKVEAHRLRAIERELLHNADVLCFASRDELEGQILEGVKRENTFWVPPPVAIPHPEGRTTSKRADTILFAGTMSLPNNEFAAQWFATEVFPAIRSAVPDSELIIAGRSPTERVRKLAQIPGVKVVENPGDMGPLYSAAALVIVPLFHGAGVKVRVLEALSYGKAVIASAKAVEGTDLEDGQDLLLANTREAFIESTLKVLADEQLRQQLGATGRRHVERVYAAGVVGEVFEVALIRAARARTVHGGTAGASSSPVVST